MISGRFSASGLPWACRTTSSLSDLHAGGVSAESTFVALVEKHGPMVLCFCRSVLRVPHGVKLESVCEISLMCPGLLESRNRFSTRRRLIVNRRACYSATSFITANPIFERGYTSRYLASRHRRKPDPEPNPREDPDHRERRRYSAGLDESGKDQGRQGRRYKSTYDSVGE